MGGCRLETACQIKSYAILGLLCREVFGQVRGNPEAGPIPFEATVLAVMKRVGS